MSIVEFIQTLINRGVSLRLENDRIVMNPASLLSADDLEIMRQIKPDVVAMLQRLPAHRLPVIRADVERHHEIR